MIDSSSDLQYPEQFLKIIQVLNAAGVRYILIGGVAMVLQGSSHLTRDIDIYYEREASNIEKLVAAIGPLRPYLRGLPKDLPFVFDARTFRSAINFTLVTDLGDIDLLGDVPGAEAFPEVYGRSVIMDLNEGSVRVSSIQDLISMKRAAARPKDLAHLVELEALLRLVSE